MTEPEALRFCVDCKHCSPMYQYLCARPRLIPRPLCLVTGEPITPTCESERANADKCGRGARYWSKREEKE